MKSKLDLSNNKVKVNMLTHLSLLSRAHSNYLAQINMQMNERQEKTSDILGKLTVVGTIVLPMNVVTGIWGMNCKFYYLHWLQRFLC